MHQCLEGFKTLASTEKSVSLCREEHVQKALCLMYFQFEENEVPSVTLYLKYLSPALHFRSIPKECRCLSTCTFSLQDINRSLSSMAVYSTWSVPPQKYYQCTPNNADETLLLGLIWNINTMPGRQNASLSISPPSYDGIHQVLQSFGWLIIFTSNMVRISKTFFVKGELVFSRKIWAVGDSNAVGSVGYLVKC